MQRSWKVLALGVCLAAASAQAVHARHAHSVPKTLLAFQSLYGVDGPFVGDANPVRGVPGDGLPWEIPRVANGVLTTDGGLFLAVRGLVIADDEGVPADLRGVNPDATFRGLVSCLTEDGDSVVERNVATREFKADRKGNSLIAAKLELPNPCVAPIVMILAGKREQWFAMTGFESEEVEE
jgi:hypothetical protein